MPELPEVETVRRGLERLIVGRTITDMEIKVSKMIKLDSKVFKQELIGETFSAVKR
ncbi:DNA-formamidopyrimidine glycosylase family protein, partial [Streptococcus suis]